MDLAFFTSLQMFYSLLSLPALKASDELIRAADFRNQRPYGELGGWFRYNNFLAFGIGIGQLDGNTAADVTVRTQGVEHITRINFRKMLEGNPGFVIRISVDRCRIKMKIGVMNHDVAGLDSLNNLFGLIVKAFTGRNKYGHCHPVDPGNVFI
jgi:hypothetical protein